MLQVRSDRRDHRPFGLYGGSPGQPSENYLNPDGENRLLPSKFTMTIKKGDVFCHVLAGAGGYGDPLERNAVLRDVRNELATKGRGGLRRGDRHQSLACRCGRDREAARAHSREPRLARCTQGAAARSALPCASGEIRIMAATYRAGVDIGGTFTDIVLLGSDRSIHTSKVPSTVEDYAAAIVDGLTEVFREIGVGGRSIEEIRHGTTVASNAILERTFTATSRSARRPTFRYAHPRSRTSGAARSEMRASSPARA